MNKPKIECVFLDLDGVVCDFEKRFSELFGVLPSEAESKNNFYPLFLEFIKNKQFESLDLMPGASVGIDFLRKCSVPVQILSSTANEELFEEVSKQKQIWLQKNAITFNPIFVPGKSKKKKYAKENRIIIDDTTSICLDWRNEGGMAIEHKDWNTTLTILKMYI